MGYALCACDFAFDAFISKFHKNKKKPREDKAHEHKKQKQARFDPMAGATCARRRSFRINSCSSGRR
jgi:hypothetical protein